MSIGLSTYAFFWQWQPSAARPLSAIDLVDRTADLGAELLQLCDYPPLDSLTDAELADLAAHAVARGVRLELGTRGIGVDHLARYLRLAEILDVTLVRSMLNTVDHRPSADEAVALLQRSASAYAESGVTLALETYEQVPVATLVEIVERVDSPAVGICLDPGNCVAALELPQDTIERTAAHVRNLHVKDFAFSRKDGWVGFTFAGCPLGDGLLDYDAMISRVRPEERGINQIIEHWLPWQGDSAATIDLENQWTVHGLNYLRSKQA